MTGHSLGGALATLASFGLAGLPEELGIPKPVTCISVAAPFSGTRGYQMATERLESEGFLRSLRVNLPEDPVPKPVPFCTKRDFPFFEATHHCGINLRLAHDGCIFEHTSRGNFRDSLLEPRLFRNISEGFHHSIKPFHVDRIGNNYEHLKDVTIEDLYQDEKVVSKEFLEGTF